MNARAGVRISGVGHYLPDAVLSNADLERTLETTDEWIVTRTGMKERRIVAPGERTSDLATHAARRALDRANLSASQIDCYVVATFTPDYLMPATACLVAARLGAVGVPAFDISIACSGFVYGLVLAASLVRSGTYRRVMLIGAETCSAVTDPADRGTAILFGDGAGAVVLEADEQDALLASDLGADGRTPQLLYVPARGTAEPLTDATLSERRQYMRMEGREVYRFAVTKMVESTQCVLERAGLRARDVAYLIPHQANLRIIDAAAKHLDIPMERILVNIERYGNTSAASIPILLSEAAARGALRDGDTLVFVAFGGGLSWGSVAWRWSA